jgi:hypothetical protein
MAKLKNFWNGTHELAVQADKLFQDLVPSVGDCKTLQGELIRASSRISYDWYNNGWGCNNWSGAVQFILAKFKELPVQPDPEVYAKLRKNLSIVADYSHGEPCNIDNSRADKLVTSIHEIIVQAVINNPEPIKLDKGMFEYSETDYVPICNDGDDEADYDDDYWF